MLSLMSAFYRVRSSTILFSVVIGRIVVVVAVRLFPFDVVIVFENFFSRIILWIRPAPAAATLFT